MRIVDKGAIIKMDIAVSTAQQVTPHHNAQAGGYGTRQPSQFRHLLSTVCPREACTIHGASQAKTGANYQVELVS